MKALLMLLVIAVGLWLWRSRQASNSTTTLPKQPAAPKLLDMVRCQHCGMHIPVNEAVIGQQGVYCSAAHLRQSEP